MSENRTTYKAIFKATSLFGSVHIVNVIISIIRSKFLAILIGPEGYGIFGLLNSTVDIVRRALGLSIETSGVKKISQAYTSKNQKSIVKESTIIFWIAIITGFLGSIISVLFSKQLSYFTFGDYNMTMAIALVGVTILFKQLTEAQSAIMQGVTKLKFLAKSGLYGNVIGLFITLPLFYLFGLDAIVPAIIISSFLNYLVSYFYFRRLKIKVSLNFSTRVLKEGKEIIVFGGLLTLGSFLPVLVNYLMQIYIRYLGDIESVGLFSVGLVMLNAYVGVIFIAMSTEYYPRLAGFNKNIKLENEAVNQQAIVSMLIIVPVIVGFLFFKDLVIKLLFSKDFILVLPMLVWAVPAMLFKAVSWSLGYLIIARADSAVFVKTAVVYNAIYFVLCAGGYYFGEMKGLGIGLCIFYFLHLVGNYIVTSLRYGVQCSRVLIKIFIISFLLCSLSFLLCDLENLIYRYLTFIVIFSITIFYSYYEIDKRIDVKSLLAKYIKKKK
ncbi:MAG: hypothetical protein BM557_08820 [Flavobacterium sp. MedPE-SWcel]|uniref:oligosaccharide flippase family protein n=1 Tax=uncultured Flavobacterium sp. TaxID=165435 RepID=UPI0009208A1F|nr:oligosaccharide flippase family protein [uncultured Flavobacterium sp.]OIQ17303.1 MAG: hypothetical protein BM557_08820 [Flavobacterium sp. MedPE-SWcel]